MPAPNVSTAIASTRHNAQYTALFASVSIAALLVVAPGAYAKPIGNWSAAPSAAAIAAAQSGSQEAAKAARDANNALKRATLAIQAMQSTQQAARDAAKAALNAMPQVPNGLGAGGLQIGAGVRRPDGSIDSNLWQGANLPTQFVDGDRTKVDINQTQQKAILTWDTFNIGANTDLNFNQHGNRNWVALNRVLDPNMAPSRILGSMTAEGSVYVINANGVIFGGTSQVNVGTLIASTANISNDQFLNKGIYSTQTGGIYLPSFTGATGVITVEAGAQIETRAPDAVTAGGGFVLLMGRAVDNAGIISTPNGQTMLAAGHDFALRRGYGTDANQNSTTRGNEISTGTWNGSRWSNGDGSVSNEGLIFAQQGDITLAGHAVLQDGVLLSTTSVNQRGTIHLINSATDTLGSVTLTGNSLTDIMPELDSTDTALNARRDALITASGGNPLATGQFDNLSSLTDRKDRSRIEIVSGGIVNFQNNSLTIAQGGDVAVTAGKRVFAESGSTIDVSGVRDVLLPMSANNILVNVQGNELRDSPANRDNGFLANADVWIDLRSLIFVPAGTGGYASDRYYTPGGLLEVGGYLSNTKHTIGEWASVGGAITLSAPEVVTQKGSVFDISGGSVHYDSGYITTTNFLGSNGRLYNINNADANMTYVGLGEGFVRKNDRWGITEVWTSPFNRGRTTMQWEDGYTVGRDAGQLIISAPTSVLEGDILADVVAGDRQFYARPTNTADGYKSSQNAVALAGQLVVGRYNSLGNVGGYNSDIKIGDVASITDGMSADSALPSDRTNTVYLDAQFLTRQNLGGVTFTSTGQIAVDAPVTFAPGAQITFAAPNITIGADVTAHGGIVTLGNEIQTRLTQAQAPFWQALLDSQGKSQVTIDNNAMINLSGLWLNQFDRSQSDSSGLAFLDGGTLNVATTGGLTFAVGSVIDVSSGAAILANGKTQGGKGGNVSLIANDYSRIVDDGTLIDPSAPLIVDGKITAYGFNGGGTLTLKAGQTVVIGDDATLTGGNLAAGTPAAISVRLSQDVVIPAGGKMPFDYNVLSSSASPTLLASYKAGDVVSTPVTLPAGTVVPIGVKFDHSVAIQPVLTLNRGIFNSGFSNYVVSSNTGLEIVGNISPNVPVYRFNAASYSAPTGSRISDAADLWLPPTYLDGPVAGRLTQRAGASLTFGSLYDFSMTRGSSVTVDPGQNVTIYANRQTTIEGSITAHGGNISVASVPNAASGIFGGFGFLTPTRSIWIGEDSTLDVSAQAVMATDARGNRYGVVPGGGSITLGGSGSIASEAFIIVRPGAVLDASGTAGMIDVWSASGLQPTMVVSDGGAISLYSASGMYLDGDLRAAAGGAGASGGLLSLNVLSHLLSVGPATPTNPNRVGAVPEEMQRLRNITIVQHDQPTALSSILEPGERDPALKFGEATISVDKIHAGGFDQLALSSKDLFVFSGNVDLAMNRSIVLSGGVIVASASDPHSSAHLAAPYVKLDGWFNDPSLANAKVDEYYSGLNSIAGPSQNTSSNSSFRVDADLIDVSSAVRFGVHAHQGSSGTPGPTVDAPGFNNVVLHSSGDVRFGTGSLTANLNLAIEAALIYPLSGSTVSITAGQYLPLGGIGNVAFDPAGTITIRKIGDAAPDVPPSVFGNLALIAPNIDQGGVVRAPLGIISFNNSFGNQVSAPPTTNVVFRNGSLTSTSANGLVLPFGGTSDGVSYQGADGTIKDLGSMVVNVGGILRVETGLMITGQTVIGEAGAVLDVSGGGDLTGAGFISGRGGSVNVLTTALVNANPANSAFSASGNKVYAIVPGYASAYAPMIATKGAGDPAIGQQIAIPAGVPRLPAGTYTLLPSSYALLPGAYRVELGSKTPTVNAPTGLPNGSVLTSGYLGLANTGIRNSLPTQVILTGGQTVRTYSQYNETSYADFLRTQAYLFGGIRPRLPIDGGILQFNLGIPSSGKALSFAGTALFDGAEGGVAGTLGIQTMSGAGIVDIAAPGQAAAPGHVTVSSDDINAFNASVLVIGGASTYSSDGATGGRIFFTGGNVVNVLDGATLRAGQIFLVGSEVNVANGATLDTRGLGSNGVDSALGYVYGNTPSEVTQRFGPAVLAVANGWFNFLPFVGDGEINIGSGSSLLTEGSIVLGAPGSLTMGDANLGARYLSVTQTTVNVGTDASLANAQAAGQLPAGWNLTQSVLDRLLHPSSAAGVPTLEQLTVVAGGSINFFGDVSLDARSQSSNGNVQLVVNSPALYGLGNAGDGAHILADTFVWNGIRTGNGSTDTTSGGVPYGNQNPAPIVPNGPGTGVGSLDIAAKTVLFGYGDHTRPTDGISLNRYAIGFSAVNVSATEQVTTNSDGALFIGQSRDASGNVQGGTLNIATPLLTAQQGAVMAFNAGGALAVTAPAGVAPANAASVANLGGTVSFNGDSVVFDTTAALPSGRLTLQAVNDVSIGGHAVIDLSGRLLTFYDKSAYSWGGDLVLQSAHGDITQAAGSLINVSAQSNVAGTITATATDQAHGSILFNGALDGSATGGYAGGEFTIQAQDLGNFAALNNKLNNAGFFGARAFDIKRGDLVVGNEVKANYVSISVDSGSITVNGTIDASGNTPGTIRLAARDDLTLASSAVLDTRSTELKTDSYGAPIEADNTSHVELTSSNGFVNLNGGATIDMRSADSVARGKLEINVPRLGSTGTGATLGASIPDAGDGTLSAGTDVPANAQGNDIAISATGPLNIFGASSIALNAFATYKNAPVDLNDPNNQIVTQKYLDLIDQDSQAFITNIYGSDVAGGVLTTALQNKLAGLLTYGNTFHVRPGVEISSSSPTGTLSTQGDLDFTGYRYGPSKQAGALGSGEPGKLVVRAGGDLKINGSITDGFAPPPRGTPDEDGFQTAVPRSVAGEDIFPTSNVTLAESWTVPNDDFYANMFAVLDTAGNGYFPGDTIPAGTTIDIAGIGIPFGWEAGLVIPAQAIPGAPRPIYALAQPLAPGSMSWSMRLVSGADTGAADSRLLRSALDLNGAGNMTLADLHLGGSDKKAVASVIRTGTGDLELLAGGNYTQTTPYGVYTAGTAVAVDGLAGRGKVPSGSVLGAGNDAYEATLKDANGNYKPLMYSMEHGGDLLLTAQGNIDGSLSFDSTQVGGWLWRQGGEDLDQRTAWGINFGSYTSSSGSIVHLSTFSGIGALGGGNVSLRAGGDIGDSGLVVAIGGSGRVMADGSLVQTGGGTLSVKAGGNIGDGGNQFVNLRGDINIATGDFGSLYGTNFGYNGPTDPRPVDPLKPYTVTVNSGGSFVPGDGAISIRARGDVAMGDILDPGRVGVTQQTDASETRGGQAATWFMLWTQNTTLDIFGAGGTVSPLSSNQGNYFSQSATTLFLPSILRVTAGNGDIYLSPGSEGASLMLPSPEGELQLLAAGSIIQAANRPFSIGPLSTSLSTLATPFNPGWAAFAIENSSSTLLSSNYWGDPNTPSDGFSLWKAYNFGYDASGFSGLGGNPFVFGPNTVSDASAFNGSVTSSIYAVRGDILNLIYGQVYVDNRPVSGVRVFTNNYRAAKPVQILAGGDIVDLKGLILQNDPHDVSVIAASGNIVYAGVSAVDGETQLMSAGLKIAGPGTLEVTAGKNLYQGSVAAIESIGSIVTGDTRPGASVALQAGVGKGAPGEGQVDWTGFAKLYLDPANLVGPGPLADQPGKVAKIYNSELVGWLKTRFGYAGSAEDALTYFFALPSAQQRIFLRTVYYAELTAGGREFNDKNGPRTGSYLRGREAVAALFPHEGAYDGDITAFTAKQANPTLPVVSGFVHTDFGGDIQLLAPGGGVTIGSEGLTPGADSGLITQGGGNIQIYSQESILLGLSRIMTTFGGDILAWSDQGDINAGRGSKTTVVFTPPRVVYDDYGNISLAPVTPSTGAGIATLNPIPGVPVGSVDLIAPLGTIDAGEAGIRSSGNVNLAALHIVNAANISAQGNVTGVPQVQAPNIGGLTEASNTAGAAAQQAAGPKQGAGNAQPSIIIVEVLGFGGGGGDGSEPGIEPKPRRERQSSNYDPNASVEVLGNGPDLAERARSLSDDERRQISSRLGTP